MLVTFAPDTKFVASPLNPPNNKKPTAPNLSTAPTKDSDSTATAKAKAPTEDAKAKTPFVFVPPTIETKSDEEVINGIDDAINEMKKLANDGNKLLNKLSPQSLKSPISPKTGNPRRSSKDELVDKVMKEKTEAKRKKRESDQKKKRERVVEQKRDDISL